MSIKKPLLRAIFSTANFNGVGATLMSADVGSALGTVLYLAAVSAGTYNKYHGLTDGEGASKNAVLRAITHPSITAATFMGAAAYNFANATHDYMTQPSTHSAANLLIMAGWVCGFLGDNALRRLDSVNFVQNAGELGGSIKSKLTRTFNALAANPTIFYALTSTSFVMSGLTRRVDQAGNPVPVFSGAEGALGIGTSALVGAGLAYAGYRTWQAVHGRITNEQINDGKMNWMAFFAKLGYGALVFSTGEFGLAAAHLMFAGSSLKVIQETRTALKKEGPGL
jgi:hypothetical protein